MSPTDGEVYSAELLEKASVCIITNGAFASISVRMCLDLCRFLKVDQFAFVTPTDLTDNCVEDQCDCYCFDSTMVKDDNDQYEHESCKTLQKNDINLYKIIRRNMTQDDWSRYRQSKDAHAQNSYSEHTGE